MEQQEIDPINQLKNCCKKYHKLFIPDSPRQEAVAESLLSFYDKELLFSAIELFVKSNPGPFLVFDFAVQSKVYTDKVKFESKSVNKFKEIVNQTKKRMEME